MENNLRNGQCDCNFGDDSQIKVEPMQPKTAIEIVEYLLNCKKLLLDSIREVVIGSVKSAAELQQYFDSYLNNGEKMIITNDVFEEICMEIRKAEEFRRNPCYRDVDIISGVVVGSLIQKQRFAVEHKLRNIVCTPTSKNR